MNKTITQQITETMATIQVQVDKTLALVSALELQTAALIGGLTGESQPKAVQKKAPVAQKKAEKTSRKTAVAQTSTPGTPTLSDLIKEAAITLARANSKRKVTVAEVLEFLKAHGVTMDMQKPNSVIGVTLSRTPGFTKVGMGEYLYQPGKKDTKAPAKTTTKKKAAAPATAPATSGDDETEEKCPNCDNPKSQCICQRVQSAMPPLSE